MDDTERAQANKDPICVDPDDPNEQDDDCPTIYNMGGNSEMVLNKGVGVDVRCIVEQPFLPGNTFSRRRERYLSRL